MLTSIDVGSWRPQRVKEWLSGLGEDSTWINEEYIINNNVDGRELLMITAKDLYNIGADKVDLQEHILEAVERLRFYTTNISKETLQIVILRLAVQARSLQKQLVADKNKKREISTVTNARLPSPLRESTRKSTNPRVEQKQRVELDSLACISAIIKTVREITEIISRLPFSKYDDYRSMKSLILAFSLELASTAQREDRFVDKPNDIIEKSCKMLADYCDRIVLGTNDILLISPFQLRSVRLKKNDKDTEFGLSIKSLSNCLHVIDKIAPLSPAKRTNHLTVGDEIVYLNQFITGWSEKNVQKLLNDTCQLKEIVLIVKKNPSE